MRPIHSPFSALKNIEVFAVEAHAAQILVRTNAPAVRARLGDQLTEAEVIDGVAVIELDGLAANTSHNVNVSSTSEVDLGDIAFVTSQNHGDVTAKVATISDVHLGLEEFGVGRKMTGPSAPPYALQCARAAIEEATAWGAELLLVKGDLTDTGQHADWELAEELLDGVTIPVMFTPGNHDVLRGSDVDPAAGAKRLGLDFAPVQVRDLGTVRVVLADTSRAGSGTGDLARGADELIEAVDCGKPTLLAFHHNIQHLPVTWFWPPGVASNNAKPVVAALEEANPRLFLTSGHTHRNRLRWLGTNRTIPYTEVSSTSDYPGVWAGYAATTSSIHQVVRRIASPGAITWTEQTRKVLGGVWPRWSQGRLHDRTVDVGFDQRLGTTVST